MYVRDRADTKVKIKDLRIRLLRKLHDYCALQTKYMPAAMSLIMEEERARQAAADAEKLKLYLPSDLPSNLRAGVGHAVKAEASFRHAHQVNALTTVRH